MDEINLLKRKLERERKARKQAESILEKKAIELFEANRELQGLNNNLEKEVTRRSNLLRESEIKYRSIIENMELGLLEIDNNGIITKTYNKFNEMLGFEKGELVGKNATETLVVDEFVSVIEEQEVRRLKGETGVYEVKIRKKDDTELWVIVSGAPFFDADGKIIGSIGIHYDITHRKEMEENLKIARLSAIQAQQAEKQFLASMSHEIRTPLNAIIGMTHLLDDTVLDKEQAEYLEVLGSSASILKNLISDILDISKIDAGTLDVNLKTTNLKAEAYKLTNIFKAKTRESGVEFILEFDDKITNEVYCDQQLLSQVLINLMGNSEKFTQDGEVYLKISLKAHDKTSYVILFEVKDTGIGMSPEELEKIFDQFTQANVEIRSNYGGTGLGLTISKRLVDLMGGYLDVFSLQGKGTNFYFTLDLNISETEADLNIKENGDLKTHIPENKIDVLVVEDNEMNIKYITSLLRKWQLPYWIAHNGLEAIEIFHKQPFDLVFMDLNMPVMDGFEATREIRDSEHKNKDIPIIALTASTFLSKKHLALQAGMTDFLSKPFTPDQLAELVSKYSKTKLSTQMASPSTENGFIYNTALNTEHLNAVYADDLDYAKAMFETFLEIIDDEIHILVNHAEKRDLPNVKSQTHKVKPTFSMVGLNHLSEKMQTLEDDVLEMENDLVLKEVLFIQKELEHFKPIIADEIKRIELTEKED